MFKRSYYISWWTYDRLSSWRLPQSGTRKVSSFCVIWLSAVAVTLWGKAKPLEGSRVTAWSLIESSRSAELATLSSGPSWGPAGHPPAPAPAGLALLLHFLFLLLLPSWYQLISNKVLANKFPEGHLWLFGFRKTTNLSESQFPCLQNEDNVTPCYVNYNSDTKHLLLTVCLAQL